VTRKPIRLLERRSASWKRADVGAASFLKTILTVMLLFTAMASAARIKSFSNCLPDKIAKSPTHLQFHPLHIAAAFGTGKDHNLAITIWGNVTGRSSSDAKGEKDLGKRGVMLEPQDWTAEHHQKWLEVEALSSPFRKRAEPEVSAHLEPLVSEDDMERDSTEIVYETTGEILGVAPGTNKATTLVSTFSVLNYSPFKTTTYFCKNDKNAAGTECPLKPALVKL
jgi:hypothetical protein